MVALLVRARMVTNPVLCRILIVDDNADLAEATSMMLGICGFETRTAYNGRVAMEQAPHFNPRSCYLISVFPILTDTRWPPRSGVKTASRPQHSSLYPPLTPIRSRRSRGKPGLIII